MKNSKVAKYRKQTWKNSSRLFNEQLVDEGQPQPEFRMECSQHHCRARWRLRMTPSGIYCSEHYHTLPACSEPGCFEPAIEDGLCRDHWIERDWTPEAEEYFVALHQQMVQNSSPDFVSHRRSRSDCVNGQYEGCGAMLPNVLGLGLGNHRL